MRVEIISIGDELTSGQRLDTNSQWLSIQLADLGVDVHFHTTVGDTLEDNIDVFQTAARRADIVLSTGGLGPTADDLTREALAAAFNLPLEMRGEALVHIESLFAKRKRPMPERNRVQAMFPRSSRIIDNPHGTAPGIDLTVEYGARPSRIFALPGVPAEMQQMWFETVQPRLVQEMGLGQKRWYYRTLKVFGIGESDVEARMPDLIARDRVPRVGITVSKATISLRIACQASSEEAARQQFEPTVHIIHQALGNLVFGEADDELDVVVHRELEARSETLSVVEIGGENLIAGWLARLSPTSNRSSRVGMMSSTWFPSLESAAGRVGLASIDSNDLVAALASIAQSCARWSETDWTLALGPYPTHAEVESAASMPTSRFAIALVDRDGNVRCEQFEMGGHPEVLFARIAKCGLDYFRRHVR